MIRFTSISSGKHFISFIKCANAKLWSEELFQINDQYVLINFRDGNQLIKLCVMYFENIFAIYLRSSRKHTLLNSTYSNPASFCNNRWEYMICYQFLITLPFSHYQSLPFLRTIVLPQRSHGSCRISRTCHVHYHHSVRTCLILMRWIKLHQKLSMGYMVCLI